MERTQQTEEFSCALVNKVHKPPAHTQTPPRPNMQDCPQFCVPL